GRDSTTLSAQLSTGELLTLGSWAGHGSLRYVDASTGVTRWLSEWGTSIAPPVAMALVLERDTIALPLAGR
ncbi:MAG: hypothetical protein ABI625_22185, partial [bacterium]